MKFTKIFSEALRFWPQEIDISDGELRGAGGGYFPTLSNVWDVAETASTHLSEFHQTMVWAIFCGLHKIAVRDFKEGGLIIRKVQLDLMYVEHKFSESALNGGRHYKQIRKLYVNDLQAAKIV